MGQKGRFGHEENAAENAEENAAGLSEACANSPCHSPVLPQPKMGVHQRGRAGGGAGCWKVGFGEQPGGGDCC